ncbi:unnamed protein product [Angiostrongylus costaricensis]|uniref:Neur_chan_LBD domain-containing protein n=1 Tax=Angiostrongylus costaricensis TaxID=334426 RepID=A0A0R3PPG9_ANGCS|nr:unnamed protein product [Angiostrongylus costaricensis]
MTEFMCLIALATYGIATLLALWPSNTYPTSYDSYAGVTVKVGHAVDTMKHVDKYNQLMSGQVMSVHELLKHDRPVCELERSGYDTDFFLLLKILSLRNFSIPHHFPVDMTIQRYGIQIWQQKHVEELSSDKIIP